MFILLYLNNLGTFNILKRILEMDNLQQIIHTFSLDESRAFRRFIQRNRYKSSRVDLELYDLLAQQEKQISPDEMMSHLYGEKHNLNAYHGVRKRLMRHISDFIAVRRMDEYAHTGSLITKNIILIQHLLSHNLRKLGWKYLKKSERLAVKYERVNALQEIYDIQIENYNQKYAEHSLETLVQLRITNNKRVQEEQHLSIIGSLVKQAYEKVKIDAEDLDLNMLVDDLISRFEMQEALQKRPQLIYRFMLITRQIILVNKAFYSFEPYLVNSYKKLQKAGFFENREDEHIHTLYILSHTYYRNKKFDQAVVILKTLHEKLKVAKKGVYNQYIPKYVLLYAACENFKGNIELAIHVLESFEPNQFMDKEELLNIKLNLSVYYFEDGAFKKANQLLLGLGHTDKWLEKNIGVEWKLKKNIIEVIYQIELSRPEIAYDRITAIEKGHRRLFKLKAYQRVAVFLKLLKSIIQNPEVVKTTSFLEKVEHSFEWIALEQEDLQAMSYYAWLKSKMVNQDFYEVLRSLAQQSQEA